MKFLFLCACLEPGKDGVGDYTINLANELAKNGIQIKVIALSDQFVQDKIEKEISNNICIERYPANQNWKIKLPTIRNSIIDFHPDFISFQMVSFSYNPYGILKKVNAYFLEVCKGFKIHLMLHELWIGSSIGASVKDKILGFLERRYLLKFIRMINPIKIHTTSDYNVFLLNSYHILSEKLPVFSNIPKVEKDPGVLRILNLVSELDILKLRNDYWIFTFFGVIHPEWKPENVFAVIQGEASKHSKKVIVTSIGRCADSQWENTIKNYKDKFAFYKLGEMSPTLISQYLQEVDFAITSYPDVLVEKSGSIAALRLHGLPVIYSREDVKISGFSIGKKFQPLLIKFNDFNKAITNQEQFKKEKEDANIYSISNIAQKFISDLKI